jgi:hypothetical protein
MGPCLKLLDAQDDRARNNLQLAILEATLNEIGEIEQNLERTRKVKWNYRCAFKPTGLGQVVTIKGR